MMSKQGGNNNKIPFLRKVLLAESEDIKLPSIELIQILIKRIRRFFIDK